jgi:predicted enzyme related to lactoylglutathione lyase
MSAESHASLRSVLYPVPDVEAASTFYQQTLSTPLKFADGDRYAALDAGITLAVAAPEESVAGPSVAASFKVADVAATVEAVRQAGGTVHLEPTAGPHEIRAVAADPWGNKFILYSPP